MNKKVEGGEEKKKKDMIQPGSAGSSLVAGIIDPTTSTSGEVEASNLINVGAAGDLLNSPVMGLCGSMMTEEESPGTELSTNIATVVSVLKGKRKEKSKASAGDQQQLSASQTNLQGVVSGGGRGAQSSFKKLRLR